MNDDEIIIEDSKTVTEALTKGTPSGVDHLIALQPILSEVNAWTAEAIEAAVKQYALASGSAGGPIPLGKVAQPLRIAVSGGTVSPAIFDTLAILGQQSTLRRIERCVTRSGAIKTA